MMLSVVVLAHNSQKHLSACLASVFGQSGGSWEVILVDNASSDGTREIIQKQYPQTRLIENPRNFGASRARNQGIEASTGDWVLSLDSDVILEKNFFQTFERVASSLENDIGMVQPHVLDGDGRRIYSHGVQLTAFRRFHDLHRGKPADYAGEVQKKILGPCSAAAFYRRTMLEQLKENTGYFDERFFFLVEDVDFAWRAARSGWKTRFCPELICRHSGNGSQTSTALRRYLCFRNRRLMIRKNETALKRIRLYLLTAPYELARFLRLLVSREYWRLKAQKACYASPP